MKYNFGRKIQLDVLLGDPRYRYNSNDFMVLEADSPEEAEKVCNEWVNDWVERMKEKLGRETAVSDFENSLGEPPKQEEKETVVNGPTKQDYLK